MSLQDEKLRRRQILFSRPGEHESAELYKNPTILVAESDSIVRRKLKEALLPRGFFVIESPDKRSTLHNAVNPAIQLVIVGSLDNDSWDGLDVARQIRRSNKNLPIILLATKSSEDLAIAALRAGINDYFNYPYSLEDLVSSASRHTPHFSSRHSRETVKDTTTGIIDAHRMIGDSLVMREVRAAIGRVASTDSNVLITGETGTGKELVAELIHKNSSRANLPFVCINCAAIPDGLLESEMFGYERGSFTGAYTSNKGKLMFGDGGTIFLDEIGDLSPYAQAKILRVIESRQVQRLGGRENIPLNVRFIAATNKDLEQAVSEKTFRKDLYFRLNVAGIHLPLLKERREDIPALCDHYIAYFNRLFGRHVEGFTQETMQALLRYDWPGNVRELKNLSEATVGNFRTQSRSASGHSNRQIFLADLPEQFRRRLRSAEAVSPDERHPLLSTLIATNWNISKAARQLQWSRMTVYRKMAKYHIRRKGKP